jgi:NCS2 family nucleobase:cation symporter-2
VVIVLVAIGNGMLGFRYLLSPGTEHNDPAHWTVAMITLLVTMVLSVWSRGIVRASCALIGMIVGYAISLPMGVVPYDALTQLGDLPPVQLPRVGYIAWSFDTVLIAPFLIAALANTLKAAALLTTAEKASDADWVRPNLRKIGGGVLADGVTTALSGAFCVFGVNTSSSSVGLIEATGIASRVIAYAVGGIFVIMAFIPPLIRFFTLIPAGVIGATFIFASCTILKGGIETIASRMLDARRTLVVGLAIMTGLAVEAFPGFFHNTPASIQPLVDSPLVLGTFVGFGLNALFRIGSRRRAVLKIDPHAIDFAAIQSFVEGRGAAWGARRDVVTRASFAAQQLIEVIADACTPRGPIALSGSFNEFDLALDARYAGEQLELPDRRPTPDEIVESDDGARLLAGFLLRHNADRSTSVRRGENCTVQFLFHH